MTPPQPHPASRADGVEQLFPGSSDLAALMREKAWPETLLGAASAWPQSLRTAVRMMLASPQPAFIFWGPRLALLYNDGARPILGAKHPEVLAASGEAAFAEAWAVVGPMLQGVIDTGVAVHHENLPVALSRFGFLQDGYFTFQYLPIGDEAGSVGGVIAVVQETTAQVVGARRLALIRELSTRSALCQSVAAVLQATEGALGNASAEVPFALLYEPAGDRARLIMSAGLERGGPASPIEIPFDDAVWPLASVAGGEPREVAVENLEARFGSLPGGPSGEAARRALVLPVETGGALATTSALVVGANPRIPFDDEARSFLSLVARQLGSGIAGARALEEKTHRAAQLAELDRQKTQFFSNVSHELRTPLTLILGPTEEALAAPERALTGQALDHVHNNAQRLLKLVNTLLEFARAEAGRTRATFRPTDLAVLTAGLASAFESVVSAAGLRLVVECPPLPEPVWVDASIWEKVVLNLVSNAFKFTHAGQITVRLAPTSKGARLTVADTGVGIPAHELPNVFQRFHRVEGVHGRSHEGSGIGLSLVKELVLLHGGEVGVESKVGVGTTFTVDLLGGTGHLPAKDVASDAAGPESVLRRVEGASAAAFVREAAQWLPAPAVEGRSVPVGEHGESLVPPSPRRRVLLADDNVDMRGYVTRLLAESFVVEAVADGQAALRAASDHPPDLILSDVMMPILDGLALTRALRAEPRLRDVPVILLSARAGEEAAVEGLLAGANDYIVKPFGARELVARIEGAIRLARAEGERRGAAQRLAAVMDSTSDGFFSLDPAFRISATNASMERMCALGRGDMVGRIFWEVFPRTCDEGSMYWREYQRCMRDRVDVQFVEYYEPRDLWTDVHANPTPDGGIAVWFRDVGTEVRAKALLQRQMEFEKHLIGIVSHDLRGPLNVISLASALLADTEGLDEDARYSTAQIQSSVERATRLVRDLLDFAKARLGGGLPLDPRPADLGATVRGALDEVATAFPGRRIEVRLPSEAGPATEGGWDPDRLAQVAHNLVTNALKYSPKESAVEVDLTATEADVTLAVRNGGDPIPAEKLPILFEPFQRVAGQSDYASRSVGLGLYIVKAIADAHQGTVMVRSTEGEGTTFTVRLPRIGAHLTVS